MRHCIKLNHSLQQLQIFCEYQLQVCPVDILSCLLWYCSGRKHIWSQTLLLQQLLHQLNDLTFAANCLNHQRQAQKQLKDFKNVTAIVGSVQHVIFVLFSVNRLSQMQSSLNSRARLRSRSTRKRSRWRSRSRAKHFMWWLVFCRATSTRLRCPCLRRTW